MIKKILKWTVMPVIVFGSIISLSSFLETGGGGGDEGCYTYGYLYDCHTWTAGVVSYTPGQGYNCNFTGAYGAPYQCSERSCAQTFTTRNCVPQ